MTPCEHDWGELEGLGATWICVTCGECRAAQDWQPLGHCIYGEGR